MPYTGSFRSRTFKRHLNLYGEWYSPVQRLWIATEQAFPHLPCVEDYELSGLKREICEVE